MPKVFSFPQEHATLSLVGAGSSPKVVSADSKTTHPGKGEARAVMNDETPHDTKASKLVYRISIRMTAEERKIIGRKATLAHLSVSRFLVECATSDGAMLPQDKVRLHWLLTLFQKTRDRLRSLSMSSVLRHADPLARQELMAALHLIEALTEEMRKRLK